MGFTIYYHSVQPVSARRAKAIRKAADALIEGRTWLSCEPVGFFEGQEDGRLSGGSKPNFQPHPDDVAAAAREALPDGTVLDMIEVLCELSRRYAVDWEFHHDYDAGPVGFIRGGVCEAGLRELMEGFANVRDVLSDLACEIDAQSDPDDEDEDGPSILPFRPRND